MDEIKIVEADDGSLYFDIPTHIIKRQGWEDGDDIEFVYNDEGSLLLRKVETETDSE